MGAVSVRAITAAMLALALGSRAADAQQDPTEIAARRALIEQAERARDEGHHAQSLDLAERAAQLESTASLRLFIAQEQSAVGRTAEALGNADACARQADMDPATSHRDAVRSTCTALGAMLRERVGTLVVRIPSPPPAGLAVTVDGHALAPPLWNVPYVVTPGTVHVEANAPGFSTPIVRDVLVSARGTVTVALDAPPAVTPPVVAHPAPPVVLRRVPARPRASAGPWVLGALGGAALAGAGGALAAWAVNVAACVDAICPESATRSRVFVFGALVWTGVGLGALGLGSAIAWALLATPPARRERGTVGVDLAPLRDGAVATLRASF